MSGVSKIAHANGDNQPSPLPMRWELIEQWFATAGAQSGHDRRDSSGRQRKKVVALMQDGT